MTNYKNNDFIVEDNDEYIKLLKKWIIISYCINNMYNKIDPPNYNNNKNNDNQDLV
jgi:hypothetical protein